jgi:hypothetical protein
MCAVNNPKNYNSLSVIMNEIINKEDLRAKQEPQTKSFNKANSSNLSILLDNIGINDTGQGFSRSIEQILSSQKEKEQFNFSISSI